MDAAARALWEIDKSTVGKLLAFLIGRDELSRRNAALALGSIGAGARNAIPVLIMVFPEVSRVSSSGDEAFLPAACRSLPLLAVREAEEASLSSVVERERSLGLIARLTGEDCRDYLKVNGVNTMIRQDVNYRGFPRRSRMFVLSVDFTFYAGAWALGRISGKNFGTDRRKWQQWWESNGKNDN